MGNDPRSRWAKRQAEQPTANKDTKEISIGQRLTRLRAPQLADGEVRNRFGDTAKHIEKPEPVYTPTVKAPKVGQTILDTKTIEAKEAFEAARDESGEVKARQKRLEALRNIDELDADAILRGFFGRHQDFHPSEFNIRNLMRGLGYCLEQGAHEVTGLNIASLEAVFQWMNANGYFERKDRKRGEPAPRIFIPPAATAPEPTASQTIQRTVVTREENQALREMDFDELQQAARKGFKSPSRSTRDYRG